MTFMAPTTGRESELPQKQYVLQWGGYIIALILLTDIDFLPPQVL